MAAFGPERDTPFRGGRESHPLPGRPRPHMQPEQVQGSSGEQVADTQAHIETVQAENAASKALRIARLSPLQRYFAAQAGYRQEAGGLGDDVILEGFQTEIEALETEHPELLELSVRPTIEQ